MVRTSSLLCASGLLVVGFVACGPIVPSAGSGGGAAPAATTSVAQATTGGTADAGVPFEHIPTVSAALPALPAPVGADPNVTSGTGTGTTTGAATGGGTTTGGTTGGGAPGANFQMTGTVGGRDFVVRDAIYGRGVVQGIPYVMVLFAETEGFCAMLSNPPSPPTYVALQVEHRDASPVGAGTYGVYDANVVQPATTPNNVSVVDFVVANQDLKNDAEGGTLVAKSLANSQFSLQLSTFAADGSILNGSVIASYCAALTASLTGH